MSTIEQTPIITIKKRCPPTKKTQSKELLKRLPFLHKETKSSSTASSNSGELTSKANRRAIITSMPVISESSNNTTSSSDRVPKLNMKALKTGSQQAEEAGSNAPKANLRAQTYNFPDFIPKIETSV